MLRFVIEKMLHKKWMCFCLLIGNALLLGLAIGNPLYYHAALYRNLQEHIESVHTQEYQPGVITLKGNSMKESNQMVSPVYGDMTLKTGQEPYEMMQENISLPVLDKMVSICFPSGEVGAMSYVENVTGKELLIANIDDMENHAKMVSGEMYTTECDTSKPIPCVITERTMMNQEMMIGQEITLSSVVDKNTNKPLTFQITGVYEPESDDTFWMEDSKKYESHLFVSDEMRDYILENVTFAENNTTVRTYHMLLDTSKITDLNYKKVLQDVAYLKGKAKKNQQEISTNFSKQISEYASIRGSVRTIMLTLQVPVFILMALFIYMVSNQMITMEENEIAMLKSRGSNKKQIIGIYTIQSVLLNLAATAFAIPLAIIMCRLIGSSNAFMEFVYRDNLEITYSPDVLVFYLLAFVFSVLVMVIPSLKHAKLSIVEMKRNKKKSAKPLYLRLGADVILLFVAGYTYYNFYQQKEELHLKVAEDGNIDPMFLLASSLFIFGFSILCLRLLPKLVWLAFLQTIRSNSNQGGIALFLMVTIAFGIFNTTMARTVNQNKEEQLLYENGADIILQEEWSSNKDIAGRVKTGQDIDLRVTYTEPDYDKYSKLEDSVERMTRVYRAEETKVDIYPKASLEYDPDASGSVEGENVTMIAIEPENYGKICWMKDGLTKKHWYYDLNKLNENYEGFLISKSLAERYHIKVGAMLDYCVQDELSRYLFDEGQGEVVGIVDYWPTVSNKTMRKTKDKGYEETDNYYIIGNFDNVMSQITPHPYDIYIDVKGDNTQPVYDFVESEKLELATFKDTCNDLIKIKNDPIFQATNGILTISFLVVMILCVTGFLIYWILSIRSRELLFGIYRAMGLSKRELRRMLINEHLFSTVLAIVAGIIVGIAAATYFIPVIEITYMPGTQIIPLTVVTNIMDLVKLSGIILGMVVICIVVLLQIIARLKISQALKLGED